MKRLTVNRMLRQRLAESKRSISSSYQYEDLVNVLGGDNSKEIQHRQNMKQDIDELELEMIDFGVEEIFADEEDGILMYAPFESFGAIQKELESRGLEILSSGFDRIPQVTKELTPEQVADVEKLLEKIEEDDDVMNVFHTMVEN